MRERGWRWTAFWRGFRRGFSLDIFGRYNKSRGREDDERTSLEIALEELDRMGR